MFLVFDTYIDKIIVYAGDTIHYESLIDWLSLHTSIYIQTVFITIYMSRTNLLTEYHTDNMYFPVA